MLTDDSSPYYQIIDRAAGVCALFATNLLPAGDGPTRDLMRAWEEHVYSKAKLSVPEYQPNVILVNAGTNDCLQNVNISGASARMENMVLGLFAMSPKTTVVLSSLIPNANAKAEANVLKVNAQYAALATKLQAAGRHVVFVDMHAANGPQPSDLVDGTHPDDAGYAKMAAIWYMGLVQASNSGWLQKADPVDGLPDDGGS